MRRHTVLLLAIVFALFTLLIGWMGSLGVIDADFARIASLALPGIAVAGLYSRRRCGCLAREAA